MKNKKKIYFFVGTTAEFLKLAPIIKGLNKRNIKYKVVTSGQNRVNFKELEGFTGKIKADILLKPKNTKSSIPSFLLWAVRTFISGLRALRVEFKNKKRNDIYFIIHGDTVTSLLGSIIATLYGVKLIHIESGLRSFNFFEPIPEEVCRFIIIHLADVMFAPNDWALDNLKGLKGVKISTNQNTLIESCFWALSNKGATNYRKMFGKYYVLFVHRQEHVFINKEWTRNLMDFIIKNAPKDVNCIFVLHSLTSRFIHSERLNALQERNKRLFFIPQLSYIDFISLLNNSEFIATDGCTLQEEAYFMGKPLLALRNLTERIEGLGENTVLAKGNEKIITKFLKEYKKYKRPKLKTRVLPSSIVVDYLTR